MKLLQPRSPDFMRNQVVSFPSSKWSFCREHTNARSVCEGVNWVHKLGYQRMVTREARSTCISKQQVTRRRNKPRMDLTTRRTAIETVGRRQRGVARTAALQKYKHVSKLSRFMETAKVDHVTINMITK
jgi:hypothetical protein